MKLERFSKILNNSKLTCFAPSKVVIKNRNNKKIIESEF